MVDLSKRYGGQVALDECSFQVEPGRLTGFLGPNGAGKTTAMRCVMGLVQPDRGQVLWQGRPVRPADRLRFGYMPEERGLYPRMGVREQLVYLGQLAGLERSAALGAADRWLDRLDLAGRASDRVERLSHGNQQR
ncbi:MAG TPA: ATP-binding cassette domain-containing protein, partial [Actinomycetes bacterium]|nr:ATP-binding cassette domain-containing protein [Actinomycetes bacterium]